MKYFVLIGDGMSDRPLKELGNRTPLEAAHTPNLDFLAQHGTVGWVDNVPKGMQPGSDVANMSIFGYDPRKYFVGRGPLEAASLGIKLKKDEIAFRCNLVTIRVNIMDDFTASHITTAEAEKIIQMLNRKLGAKEIKFYTGLSYRHIMVIAGLKQLLKAKCTPPHDITGKAIEPYLPSGAGSEVLNYLMSESSMHLLEHPVNIARIKKKQRPANMIWLWGQGQAPEMPAFKKVYGKSGAVITAVHLLKGLARVLGMRSINVKGATGFLDTNYKGKAEAALKASRTNDVVFVHVEAPDECGHMGDVKLKIKAIEDFDQKMVGPILSKLEGGRAPYRILVLPDHPTPIEVRSHTGDPVPFVLFSSEFFPGDKYSACGFDESALKNAKIHVKNGSKLLSKMLFAQKSVLDRH